MSSIIFEWLKNYDKTVLQRFHTPGHKGALNPYDITEIDSSFPADMIEKAQKKTSKLLGAKHCRYLVGGSSMGIKAAVLAAGGDILIAENSHRALFEAAKLAKVNAFTVKNDYKDGLMQPLTPEAIDAALNAHPSVKAVYITSPDYYGLAATPSVAEAVKGRAYLFCDGAHGAHFPFDRSLFPASFSCFADVCNLSAHKTLPAYTQTAYLTINNDELLPKIDEALKLLGTTSPSYLFLGSLEYAADYTEENAWYYRQLFNMVWEIKDAVPCLENDDFSRLVVDAQAMGMSGERLYNRLKSQGIVAEKYDDRYVVFIVTLLDTKEGLQRLKGALCEVNS